MSFVLAEKRNDKRLAPSLHDIGKIVIPDNIILKAGKLTEDEYEVIKSHTTRGVEIIEKRIYKAAYSTDKAYQMIITGQSGVFSSKLLKAFSEVKGEFVGSVKKYCDN